MQYVRLFLALAILGGVWAFALKPRLIDGKDEFDWAWGMDFKGGVQLIYQLKEGFLDDKGKAPEDVVKRMGRSRDGLRKRVVAFHSEESKVVILGVDRILVEIPGTQDIDQVKREIGKPQYLTIRGVLERSERASMADFPGWFRDPETGESLRLSEPGIRGEDIIAEQFEPPQPNMERRYSFGLPLTEDAQDRSAELTTRFKEQFIAIMLDDEVHSVLYVREGGIRNPSIDTGAWQDAVRLQKLLKSGPLPLPFDLVQQKTVSPVLAALREASLTAMVMGVLFLVGFFSFNYAHRPYFILVASLAVAFEVGAFICVANLHWVRISLPQLAGLALLIGMSVDAFILVFEHIERSLEGKPWNASEAISLAMEAFGTELGVIFWASATTVLSLGGLFFVEGLLSEYFILLALGVAISFSAALFLCLVMSVDLLALLTRWGSRAQPFAPWLRWMRGVDLLAYAPRMTKFYKLAVPGALIIIILCWATGRMQLGIDFAGGMQIVVQLPREVDPGEIRKVAESTFDAPCEVQYSRNDGHYAIRIPRDLTQTIGGEAGIAPQTTQGGVAPETTQAGVAPETTQANAGPAASPPQARIPIEDEFLADLKDELGVEGVIVGVEQLGGAQAFANVLSSLRNALWGLVVLTLLSALLYISVTIPFWVLVALSVDMILVLAVLFLFGIPIDYPMIAAFLTFAGYSINDSIVVCHEIKALGKPLMEEAIRKTDPEFEQKIRAAISAGIKPLSSRIFLTSVTTMLTMVPLLLQGGVLMTFGVIFVFGTAVGTLSSVFIVGVHADSIVLGDTQVL